MLSTFPTLLPFLLFAFVASITPGPTNILVLSNSARYGFKAALPIIFGACASAALVVMLAGSGLGQALKAHPIVETSMQWSGTVWLSYLAWQIFRLPPDLIDPQSPPSTPRLGLWGAAGLQWINPKTWMMALAVVGVFSGNGAEKTLQVMQLSLVFFLVSLPCVGAWAVLGARSGKLLRSPAAQTYFNRGMSVLLLCAVWLPVTV
ncbi:LysE family translocator [Pseudomonas sp. Irchel s3h14]|uniref:LysE family translocator n=1 Tax=Pseudomonas sp. Irchel s3h14 TaxID=2009179 RepID=UPI000BA3D419|nr:LysE family translocator [Pseudomonas sp. Irchel s3h14]